MWKLLVFPLTWFMKKLFNWLNKDKPDGVSRTRHLINRWHQWGQVPTVPGVTPASRNDWLFWIKLVIDAVVVGVAVWGLALATRWVYLYGFSYLKALVQRLSAIDMPTISLPSLPAIPNFWNSPSVEFIGWGAVLLLSLVIIVAGIAVYKKFAALKPQQAQASPAAQPAQAPASAPTTPTPTASVAQRPQPAPSWNWVGLIIKAAAFIVVAVIVLAIVDKFRWLNSTSALSSEEPPEVLMKKGDWSEAPLIQVRPGRQVLWRQRPNVSYEVRYGDQLQYTKTYLRDPVGRVLTICDGGEIEEALWNIQFRIMDGEKEDLARMVMTWSPWTKDGPCGPKTPAPAATPVEKPTEPAATPAEPEVEPPIEPTPAPAEPQKPEAVPTPEPLLIKPPLHLQEVKIKGGPTYVGPPFSISSLGFRSELRIRRDGYAESAEH